MSNNMLQYVYELDENNYNYYYEDGSALGSLEGRFRTVLVFLGRHWQRAIDGGHVQTCQGPSLKLAAFASDKWNHDW